MTDLATEPVPAPPAPPPDLTAAAFFDVDNTLVHGSSLVHFARGLAARKYFTYRDVLGVLYAQAKFQLTGRENSDDVAAGRRKALAFIEGRCKLVFSMRGNPAARVFKGDLEQMAATGDPDFPFVGTSYRLTEHFHYWTKHAQINAVLQPELFVEISEQLAAEKGVDLATVPPTGPKGNVTKVEHDEGPAKVKYDKIPALKPAFAKDGTITAANASSISDGAAALVLMRESTAAQRGSVSRARRNCRGSCPARAASSSSMPAASPSTIHDPSTTRLPSKLGSSAADSQ